MLHRIILHLARRKGFPEGSARRGYEIVAPLGRRRTPELRRVVPPGAAMPRPALLGRRYGSPGRSSCTGGAERAARPGSSITMSARPMTTKSESASTGGPSRSGEYVSVRELSGAVNPFKVGEVTRLSRAPAKAGPHDPARPPVAPRRPCCPCDGQPRRAAGRARQCSCGRIGRMPCRRAARGNSAADRAAVPALHERYPVENLAEAVAEGIVSGHPTMPEFRLDPAEINDVIAYLKSIQD